jgi:N-carbamoylputrescine amidase
MKKTLTVALVQQGCAGPRDANLAESVKHIRHAKALGAELVLLPELHLGPYFCQVEDTANFDLAEPIPGPTCEELGQVAKELGVVIVASLFERRAPGLYHNTAVVLERDGRLAGKYRKMHIPDDPGFYEKFYFTPGDIGFKPINTSLGKLGILVCWDQWYPEAARLMTLAGADLLLYPTAIGWNPNDSEAERQRQLDAWVTIQRGHAVANGLPVLSCNRVGHEPDPSPNSEGIQFWGNSFVAGPQGEFLAHADAEETKVLIVELDRQRSEEVRRIWPFLRDRRIDEYGGLVQRFLD